MSTGEGRRGWFITLEGPDGCGKTTQMKLLARRLRHEGWPVTETVEPGGTPVGEQLRAVLLDPRNRDLLPMAELLIYFACRVQNLEQVIKPALAQGHVVLSDRFTDSTVVYQGYARGLGEEAVGLLDSIACGGFKPDLTLLLDVDLETSLRRARRREQRESGGEQRAGSRFEEENLEFHRKVAEGYRRLAEREPERIVVIDGRGSVEAVAERVWTAVTARLGLRHV